MKRHAQAGLGLVEMMVAIAITIALSAGMLALLLNTRTSNAAQSALEQLQDDQRLLLTRVIDTVQMTGYFPNPQTSNVLAELPASGNDFPVAGQAVTGSTGGAGVPDVLKVRYEAGVGDGVLDCSGKPNTSGAPLVQVNVFSVDAAGNFNCTVNGTTQPLASGVTGFSVLYGVDTNGDGSADTYLPASGMAGNWQAVASIRVTLTFRNPLAGQSGNLPPIVQTIPVLNIL